MMSQEAFRAVQATQLRAIKIVDDLLKTYHPDTGGHYVLYLVRLKMKEEFKEVNVQ